MRFSKLLQQSLLWRGLYFITLFGVNLVLSRSLKASGSGGVFYIANTFTFVQLVMGLSLENGITFFGAGKRIATNHLFWFCLLWTGIIALLLLLLIPCFPVLLQPQEYAGIPWLAFIFIIGLLLIAYGSNLFYINGNFWVSNLILSCCNLAFIGFVFLQNKGSHAITEVNIEQSYFSLFLLQGWLIVLAYFFLNKSWQEIALPSFFDIKKLLRYSLSVLLFNVLLFLVYRVDYYFVRYSPVCSANDLGNYIQASKLGQMLLVVPQIIGSAVYPQVSSGKDLSLVSRIITLLIKAFALLFLFVFLFVLFIGKWLFPFLFGNTFQQVYVPLLLLLPGIYSLAIISFISNYFSGQGNVKISLAAASVGLAVVATGDALFVPQYGIRAAAMVSSVGYCVMFLPYLVRFKKSSALSLHQFFLPNRNDVVLLASLWKKKKML